MPNTQKCPFDNCTEQISDTRFGCRKHWFSLRPGEKSTIYKAYDDYLDNEIDIFKLREIQNGVLALWRARQTAKR